MSEGKQDLFNNVQKYGELKEKGEVMKNGLKF